MRLALRWPVVLFDLDGTLLDTIPLIRESHRHAVRTVLGHDLPDDVLESGIGTPLLEQMQIFSPEHAQELFDTYRTWNHANTARLLAGFDGIDEVLLALEGAGARLGVVTSKMRDAVDLAFRVRPLPVVFDAVVTYDDTATHKPGPEPIRHALELVGAAPEDAVYVGDATADARAAAAAGVAFVGVAWGVAEPAALAEVGAGVVARTPAELLELLAGGAR